MSRGVAFPRPPLAPHALPGACAALTHSHSLACSWKRVSIPGLGELCNNSTVRGENHTTRTNWMNFSSRRIRKLSWAKPKVNQIFSWQHPARNNNYNLIIFLLKLLIRFCHTTHVCLFSHWCHLHAPVSEHTSIKDPPSPFIYWRLLLKVASLKAGSRFMYKICLHPTL